MYLKFIGVLALALTASLANALPFSVPAESATRGSPVEVSLLDQGITGLEGASIRVHFDHTVLNFDFNNSDAVQPGTAIAPPLPLLYSFEFNMETADDILVSLALNNQADVSGEILKVLFKVASNTLATSTQVSFESYNPADPSLPDDPGSSDYYIPKTTGTVNISLGGQPNQSVPEPATVLLMLPGLAMVRKWGRRHTPAKQA